MNGNVQIVDDVPAAFAALVEERFAKRPQKDRFSIALSGGSTAKPCYELLAETAIDWSIVTAVWGDERLVPLDHEDSNYLLAKRALLDRVPPLAAVHPMQGSAADYQKIIKSLLPIDVVHLGMGDDGHTASLFPDSDALESPPADLVVETGDDLHPHPRMTFTFSALNQSQLAVFTVMGAKKAEMFARIQDGERLPAAEVAAHEVIWLVDKPAAGL